MTPDLIYLTWAVVLTIVLVLIAATLAQLQVGLPTMAGTRENMPPLTGLAGRATRLHRNMLENLPLFAALVLIAAVAHRDNATTALGAAIFFWARIVHAVLYLAGVAYLRTLCWAVSIVGLVMIVVQII